MIYIPFAQVNLWTHLIGFFRHKRYQDKWTNCIHIICSARNNRLCKRFMLVEEQEEQEEQEKQEKQEEQEEQAEQGKQEEQEAVYITVREKIMC